MSEVNFIDKHGKVHCSKCHYQRDSGIKCPMCGFKEKLYGDTEQ